MSRSQKKVTRRATRLVPELRNLTFEKRLSALGLTTLEERRTRGNMIETYKLITNKEDINPNKFFQVSSERDICKSYKMKYK